LTGAVWGGFSPVSKSGIKTKDMATFPLTAVKIAGDLTWEFGGVTGWNSSSMDRRGTPKRHA